MAFAEHALTVTDIRMEFGGITALDGISIAVDPGEICGLIGPNGAGKTTLFNCISRLYRPQSGSIEFAGTDLLSIPAHRIAAHGVARTFQNLGLFSTMSVLENVLVGAHARLRAGFTHSILRWGIAAEERRAREHAYALLELLSLGHLAYSPAAGQSFGTLKRIELACALAAKPRLLLLDEPAGGLTEGEVSELATIIGRLRDAFDLTVLLVEHHMGMVMSVCEKVIVMDSGRKLVESTPEGVREHPEVIAAYLGTKV